MKARLTRAVGDYARSFSTESGLHFRRETQELGPAMARVKRIREAQEHRGTGKHDRRYVGSVPFVVLSDWCNKNRYTMDQWARNDGGIPGMMYPESKSGVKDKFMAYFLSRDFSKLHTQHVTTKRETSQFVVPGKIGGENGQLRRSKVGNS